MGYEVDIIADSIAPSGRRITTFALKYPRFIHQEVLTHRIFSRNSSSSRAIPIQRYIDWVTEDPAIPIHWGCAKTGMQSGEEIDDPAAATRIWLEARDAAVEKAKKLLDLGLHKQTVNRVLDAYAWINVVCSSTDFSNFFRLRIDKAAMPEIQKLAVMMARAYTASTPVERPAGDWHLPYITDEERASLDIETLLKVSTARCARVSYKTFEGKVSTVDEDVALYERLVGSEPKHSSPAEHQAKAMSAYSTHTPSRNFRGWLQHRQLLDYDPYIKPTDWQAQLDEYEGKDFIV